MSSRAVEKKSLKNIALQGALWLSVLSGLAVPLAFYRNWILGQFGDDGSVVGIYALLLLFIELISTFVLFGGSTVVTNYMPKLNESAKKSAFFVSYGLISIPLIFVFLLGVFQRPDWIRFLSGGAIQQNALNQLSTLVPVVVLSQWVLFGLNGLMRFRLVAVLIHVQLYVVVIFSSIVYWFAPKLLSDNPLTVLLAVVMIANLLVVMIGGFMIKQEFRAIGKIPWYPAGFWRYAGFVQCNTLCSFAYRSIDQLFVVAAIGVKELGIYFILLQCSEIIRFIPNRIGQVLLASFSKISAAGDEQRLANAYSELCTYIIVLSGCCAILLIVGSQWISGLFGAWVREKHNVLVLLAVGVNISSIGSVNSMLIMAKDRAGLFLTNSVILVSVQAAVTMLLANSMGLYAAVAGKIAGIIVGQAGLFTIVYKHLSGISLMPPKRYWLNQIYIIVLGILFYQAEGFGLIESLFILLAVLAIFFLIIGFDPRRFYRIIIDRAA